MTADMSQVENTYPSEKGTDLFFNNILIRKINLSPFSNSWAAELLFPREIYHLDMAAVKNDLIKWFRKRIEEQ